MKAKVKSLIAENRAIFILFYKQSPPILVQPVLFSYTWEKALGNNHI